MSKEQNACYDWVLIPQSSEQNNIHEIASNLNLPSKIVEILFNRGYRTAVAITNFLNPSLTNLHPPSLIKDIVKAQERIFRAINSNEPILICGDYDVDGITGTSLLLRILRALGAKVSFYIPHRIKEGYGLSETAVLYAQTHGFRLIITVDCGTTDFNEIELANKLGIDVIVCDHHEPKDYLPNAYAVLNPKRHDNYYPFAELSGVGVAFKLASALVDELNDDYLKELLLENLDLVALGTIADIAPLVDENRIFAKYGLKQLRETKNCGLKALLKATGLRKEHYTPYDISFIIAPPLNASGRLTDAEKAVRLLSTADEEEAQIIAQQLNKENSLRQQIETKILDEALKEIERLKLNENKIIVLANRNWHEGVVGIVASRIVEYYYRPVILLTIKPDYAKGSGRSIHGFNIYQAVDFCKDYLLDYGGHKYACGVALPVENIDKFNKKINDYACENLPPELLRRRLYIDAQLSFSEITPQFIKLIQQFEPFGEDNPKILFLTPGLEVVGYPRVVGKNHLKFKVREHKTYVLEAIAFGRSSEILNLKTGKEDHVDLVYNFDEDMYTGTAKLLLVVKDLRIR
ncbi:MAG: single-stranded-DNA-specific exonuclease RecJ [candidate division WOR-3 bacterium]|nr:single-stranded-DNA-specific exonuclease RecJ [candidate division WOR-3 bacterium]